MVKTPYPQGYHTSEYTPRGRDLPRRDMGPEILYPWKHGKDMGPEITPPPNRPGTPGTERRL